MPIKRAQNDRFDWSGKDRGWTKLKALVLASVSSPSPNAVYLRHRETERTRLKKKV